MRRHCNWRRPSRSKCLTSVSTAMLFTICFHCYVIAQQLPSPTYAVAMSLYQIILYHVICQWVLYMLTGSIHHQTHPPHQHIQVPPAVSSFSSAQPSLLHWDCWDLLGEQESCVGNDAQWYTLIHLPEPAGFCTAGGRASSGLVVVEAYHPALCPV